MFTRDEDTRLLSARTKESSWIKIARLFEGRTPTDLLRFNSATLNGFVRCSKRLLAGGSYFALKGDGGNCSVSSPCSGNALLLRS